MLRLGLAAILVTGCYRPAELADCSLTCDVDCPANQVCGGDKLCHAIDSPECSLRPLVDSGSRGDADPTCVGSQLVPTCITPTITTIAITGDTIDTDSDPRCLPLTGGSTCMLLADTIVVSSLTAQGTRTLALVATGTLTLGGLIDASSRTPNPSGPGAAIPCLDANARDGVTSATGGGGGAGASFQGVGGAGGDGGAAGGTTNATSSRPTMLRAGCEGTKGGPAAQGPATNGGRGGGGIAFVASTIVVANNTTVDASGAGGFGGAVDFGGGGGGSGGMIVFDAALTQFGTGVTIFADGGGGGGGGTTSATGGRGDEPNGSAVASGGGGGGGGGGNGSHGSVAATDGGSTPPDAGGGGGGGAGWILVIGPSTGIMAGNPAFSPASSS